MSLAELLTQVRVLAPLPTHAGCSRPSTLMPHLNLEELEEGLNKKKSTFDLLM
jgi:hypothetical protein